MKGPLLLDLHVCLTQSHDFVGSAGRCQLVCIVHGPCQLVSSAPESGQACECQHSSSIELGETLKEARDFLADRFGRLELIAEHVVDLCRRAAALAEDTRLAINLTCALTRTGEHTCFTTSRPLNQGRLAVSQPCIATSSLDAPTSDCVASFLHVGSINNLVASVYETYTCFSKHTQ